MRRPQFLLAVVLAAAATLAGCTEDQQLREIAGPDLSNGLFERYVSLGNSITAGFQSAGILDSTQLQAYPVLLARQAGVGARFNVPQLAFPGCPPPFTQPFLVSTARLGGPGAPACALLETPAPQLINNLAVTGLFIAGALDNSITNNPPSTDVFKTLVLGGRTQVQAMIDAQPTFVTVWLGNNDLLEPVNTGDTTRLTPLASFQESLAGIADAIKQTPARDAAVLIGLSPYPAIAQPGAYFFALQAAGQSPKPVNANCSPLTATGQPNPLAGNLVYLPILAAPQIPEVNCANDAPLLLSAAEQQVFYTRITQYNAAIKATADANGWLYFDPNVALAGPSATAANFRFIADPTRFKLCQGVFTATTPAAFQAAVATTCPGPGANGSVANFFGTFVSFDAVHPTAAFHQAIANALATAINDFYGTMIATG